MQALELPYTGGSLVMLIVLPCENGASLPEGTFEDWTSDMSHVNVRLELPRFRFEWGQSVVEELTGLGFGPMFDGATANFGHISDEPGMHVDDVIHKSFVAVDEFGTEAAAVTAVMMLGASMPAKTVEMVVDRPFHFFIMDKPTGTVVFAGRVTDPNS